MGIRPQRPDAESLPIEEVLPRVRQLLASNRTLVVQAPPGAGKTTRIPLALLNEPWLGDRKILLLEPRRLAARAAAAWMADLLGEAVGQTVGYRIRFDVQVSARTRIEVVTEGILTRRLQSDPGLDGVGLVIFDEVHERHLHTDLALALCLDTLGALRDDLRLVLMSATLDVEPVARLVGGAPVATSEGRSHPVEVRYLTREPEGPIARVAADAVGRCLPRTEGDLLVFLPGEGEIRRAKERLLQDSRVTRDVVVHPLFGSLPREAQDSAIRPDPSGRRKVVLATSIAETSLTIQGIQVVVDAGWARAPRFDPRSGLSRLETVRVSRASAEQRTGRAGRLGPGLCLRLWTRGTHAGLLAHTVPEIRSADLAPLALDLALWGVADQRQLAWLDPPPAAAMAQARALLVALGALDGRGQLTEVGRAMATISIHPRLAHMLHCGRELDLGALACDAAALLSERDLFAAREGERPADFVARLDALHAFRERGRVGARAHGADHGACVRVDRAARQLRRTLRVPQRAAVAAPESIGLLLAFAYPDRIAWLRSPGGDRYLLANGRGARLRRADELAGYRYLVAASVDRGKGRDSVIHLAAGISLATLREHLPECFEAGDRIAWDAEVGAVVATREERLGSIVVAERALDTPAPDAVRAAMIEGIRALGLETALPWTSQVRQWQARVSCAREWFPDSELPDLTDAHLAATLEVWLAPYLEGVTRRSHLERLDVLAILRDRVPWQQRKQVEAAAPTHLTVPSGARHRLEYARGQPPSLSVKIQEMFGLADTPRVAGGKIPVVLHLLSPARRPIQVTQDLRGFWDRTYAEVRKELKGRYPKHPWPEDPWAAAPTARTKRGVRKKRRDEG